MSKTMITRRAVVFLSIVLLGGGVAVGFINPRFTPVDLVRQADVIVTWELSASRDASVWVVAAAEELKGTAGEGVSKLTLKEDPSGELPRLLSNNGKSRVILFSTRESGYLSVAGQWLSVKPIAGGWEVEGPAPKVSGVFAGGTDMLIRVTRYILTDPKATVPVSVATSWMETQADMGKVAGNISGMQSLWIPSEKALFAFVGSDKGDRIFRATFNNEVFTDVTTRMGLETRSVQFLWTDLNDDASPDLVTWDGKELRVRTGGGNGKFVPAGPRDLAVEECLGLSECTTPDGKLAVLVSTKGVPVMLSPDDKGKWKRTDLPTNALSQGAPEAATACVAADFDNDGWADVIQLRPKTALMWRGSATGFAEPVACGIEGFDGRCPTALADLNQDGLLDLFVSDADQSALWENDGRGRFVNVTPGAGSLSYKGESGLSQCLVTDLNHDGRTDLCMLHPKTEFTYHFNRGFRCMGEEGELSLSLPPIRETPAGQVAGAVADFNGDGSLDLAVAWTDGTMTCFYNEGFSKPLMRVGLAPGVAGPLTVSVWTRNGTPMCMGTISAGRLSQWFATGASREVTLKWSQPRRGDVTMDVVVPGQVGEGGFEVLVGK